MLPMVCVPAGRFELTLKSRSSIEHWVPPGVETITLTRPRSAGDPLATVTTRAQDCPPLSVLTGRSPCADPAVLVVLSDADIWRVQERPPVSLVSCKSASSAWLSVVGYWVTVVARVHWVCELSLSTLSTASLLPGRMV